ncbi:MAG: hypothetical protein QHH74_09730 [Spirochaetota bacterium]|nr:hypothetical protein [Spirochaetota bacterium]
MEEDHNNKKQDLPLNNPPKELFALQMYMNRFMWISTKEIVAGTSSWYYNDTKGDKENK